MARWPVEVQLGKGRLMETIRENPLWSDRRVLTAGIILYALIHIPFIVIGFGEQDAWRNGFAALNLGKGLGYEPSRFPGYPVLELTYGALARIFPSESLWIYTNSLTLILTLIGMVFYFNIVQFHKISRPLTTVSLLFFIPIIFVNASSSMDYLWTVTFILIAYWSLLQKRPTTGGIFLGLAIGVRMTTGIFLLPFLIFLIGNPEIFPKKTAFRSALLFIFSALILSGICYLPLMVNYHFSFLTFLFPSRDFLRSGYYIMQEIFGFPGWVFLILLVIIKRKGLIRWNWERSLWGMIIAFYLALFLVKPEKVEYLIPMFPFLCLWLAQWLTGTFRYLWIGLIILNNILSFGVVELTPKGISINKMDKGVSWKTYQRYQKYRQDADYLIYFPYPPDTKVKMGYRHPGVLFLLELPAYQKRKIELQNNQIIFPENFDAEKKRNTYWVFGSLGYKEERQFLSSKKHVILYPPSTRTGP